MTVTHWVFIELQWLSSGKILNKTSTWWCLTLLVFSNSCLLMSRTSDCFLLACWVESYHGTCQLLIYRFGYEIFPWIWRLCKKSLCLVPVSVTILCHSARYREIRLSNLALWGHEELYLVAKAEKTRWKQKLSHRSGPTVHFKAHVICDVRLDWLSHWCSYLGTGQG